MSLANRIKKIQNGAKSLRWGCTRHSETETLFVVGHISYPREVHYFVVTKDLSVEIVTDDNRMELVKSCEDESEVLNVVFDLLKQWFPAKS